MPPTVGHSKSGHPNLQVLRLRSMSLNLDLGNVVSVTGSSIVLFLIDAKTSDLLSRTATLSAEGI